MDEDLDLLLATRFGIDPDAVARWPRELVIRAVGRIEVETEHDKRVEKRRAKDNRPGGFRRGAHGSRLSR